MQARPIPAASEQDIAPAATATVAPASTVTTSSTPTVKLAGRSCGDFDGDGDRDTTDALEILKGAMALVRCPLWLCDVTGEGVRTAADALTILRSAVGLPAQLRCASPGTTTTSTTTTTIPKRRPNIIVVLTDDQTPSSVAKMPLARGLLASQGTTFTNFYTTQAICGPSRASILRGQYPHNHGILDNTGRPKGGYEQWNGTDREQSTLATWLQRARYRTALIGKYLNGYEGTAIPPGWTQWHAISGDDSYYSYTMNENGVLHTFGGAAAHYETDVIRDKALTLIRRWAAGSRPFFLYLSPFAPHEPATPALRHSSLFRGIVSPRRPSFDEEDVSDKPDWIRSIPLLTSEQIAIGDALYRRRLASLQAVDEMIADIVRTLGDVGELDNTYIVFTSDNGYHIGEHRLPGGKGLAYAEDVRVPFMIRGPGVPAGVSIPHMALNNDIAPTIAELAGVTPADFVDGRSLANVWSGAEGAAAGWRQAFYSSVFMFYKSIRTRSYFYTEWQNGEKELFDLKADPFEMNSLHSTADKALLDDLSAWMKQISKCAGAACRDAEDDR